MSIIFGMAELSTRFFLLCVRKLFIFLLVNNASPSRLRHGRWPDPSRSFWVWMMQPALLFSLRFSWKDHGCIPGSACFLSVLTSMCECRSLPGDSGPPEPAMVFILGSRKAGSLLIGSCGSTVCGGRVKLPSPSPLSPS